MVGFVQFFLNFHPLLYDYICSLFYILYLAINIILLINFLCVAPDQLYAFAVFIIIIFISFYCTIFAVIISSMLPQYMSPCKNYVYLDIFQLILVNNVHSQNICLKVCLRSKLVVPTLIRHLKQIYCQQDDFCPVFLSTRTE